MGAGSSRASALLVMLVTLLHCQGEWLDPVVELLVERDLVQQGISTHLHLARYQTRQELRLSLGEECVAWRSR